MRQEAEDAQHTAEVAAEEADARPGDDRGVVSGRGQGRRQIHGLKRELKYHRSTRRAAVVFEGATIQRVSAPAARHASRAAHADVAVPATVSAEARRRGDDVAGAADDRVRDAQEASPPAAASRSTRAPTRRRPLPRRTAAYANPRTPSRRPGRPPRRQSVRQPALTSGA